MKNNGMFKTGTSCEPSFGTQLMSFWTKQVSLEKTWVTSMLKGTLLVLSLTWSPHLHMFYLNIHFSTIHSVIHCLIANLTLLCFLDGCQEWRSRSRRLMSTTGPWMVMEISTGGSSLGLTTCLQNSCVLSRGKWVRSWSSNKSSHHQCS